MPEGDRFENAFAVGWRRAYRRAREGAASPAEIADTCMTALARTLRERGGVPGLREMEAVVTDVACRLAFRPGTGMEGAKMLRAAFDELDRIVRDADGHRHTKVAADAARQLLVQLDDPLGNLGGQSFTTYFAEQVCLALVEHHFFARARQSLVAEGKLGGPEEALAWQQGVEAAMRPAIQTVAKHLAREPRAGTLRAPRRTVARQSTKVLLEEALVSN